MNKEEYKQHCILQANYWMALATTGAAKNRQIFHGDKTPLTDDEKIQDALSIANTHISNYWKICNGIEY